MLGRAQEMASLCETQGARYVVGFQESWKRIHVVVGVVVVEVVVVVMVKRY